MPLVTLTTDFGLKDHYGAMIKGAILSQTPAVTFVDISHNVPNYDIVQAAFIFRNSWKSFPPGTIHLISVNDLAEAADRFLLLGQEGHFFIAPDNGLLPLVLGSLEGPCSLLPWPEGHPFPIQQVFAAAVAKIVLGEAGENFGEPLKQPRQRLILQPVINKAQIRGTVVYIDHYDNVVVNVSRTLFENLGQDRPFALYFKRHEPITELSLAYADVPIGDTLCRFNAAGFLEIAINMGKAASLLGLKIDDTVQIDFLEF